MQGIIRQERLNLPMRKASFILLCGLILVPGALAAVRVTASPGDGALQLRDVNASKATISAKGAVWGQLDSGQVKVTDYVPDDNITAQVSGAESKRSTSDPGVTIYTGKNIHFRFTGNRFIKFSIVGAGLDVTAVGVGRAYLVGDPEWYDDGDYAVDDGKWQPVPLTPKLILFGTQATSAP
jgi:hypothetical protein